MSRSLTIATCQYEPHVGDVAGNQSLAVAWAEKAVAAGAELVVLPELASSGYVLTSDAEATATAAPPTSSAFIDALVAVARRGECHIVTGFNEAAGDCRHNSAVLVGPDGAMATYRKLHLFYNEQTWFQPGADMVVVDLPWGRLGMLVCYDLWFPEVARSQAIAGADVIAVPTNWVSNFKATVYDDRGYCQGNYVAMATAAQNGVVMACADRIGIERDVQFLGASIIVGADGWPVAGPASATAEALLLATVEIDSVTKARTRTPRNNLLNDRRPDAYNVAVARADSGRADS